MQLLGLAGADDQISIPSPTETLVLRLLISKPMYGQELVNASEGALKRGTVYVTLMRMEEKGFLRSTSEPRPRSEGGLPRRRYEILGEGQRALAAAEMMLANLGRA